MLNETFSVIFKHRAAYLLLFAELDVDTMRCAVKTTKDIKFIKLKDSSGGI